MRLSRNIFWVMLAALSAMALSVNAASPAANSTSRPGPDNTGPHGNLRPTTTITVVADNAVVEGVNVTGVIEIKAKNVTVRNFRIDAAGEKYGIRVFKDASVVIEDGEIVHAVESAIYGNDWTARRLNIHHMGSDGVKGGGNNTLEDCWLHHLGMDKGAHADGVQLDNGSHFIFRHNNFELPWWLQEKGTIYRTNSCFFLDGWYGPIDDVLIEDNWLNGGNYAIFALKQSNTRVIKNRMGRDFQYKLLDGRVAEWSGNVWEDSGDPAP